MPLRPTPYGELPSQVAEDAVPAYPRIDLPAKVDGSFLFAGDVRLPGMLYAAIRHGPMGDTELTHYDAKAGARTLGP